MKILLLGEYSNVHWTLAEGLRALGQDVIVVSDGDAWKNYPRDIDLRRRSLGRWDTMSYLWKVLRLMPKLKGYDVVQLINPIFLDLRVERMWKYYEQLKRQNGKIILGAFGMDYYWVKAGVDCHTFRYSDFNLGSEERHSAWNDQMKAEWLEGEKGRLNQFIAQDCAGIVSGLYEYDVCYRPYFAEKLKFIPYPIKPDETVRPIDHIPETVRFFIGIQRGRSAYKGTDIMLRALERLEKEYARVKALSNTANGTIAGKEKIMLETYIQMTYFDRIIARANTRLMVMSGGQYELKRRREAENNRSQSGLDLDVTDHYNGTERSVKTLSGGESFKASLSLALGLADEIQASAGGVKLDTMFVDEGFGSLDEESLDQALRALASLAEGNRLVGIISHVGELKNRIDKQIVVKKDQSGGSRATIIV